MFFCYLKYILNLNCNQHDPSLMIESKKTVFFTHIILMCNFFTFIRSFKQLKCGLKWLPPSENNFNFKSITALIAADLFLVLGHVFGSYLNLMGGGRGLTKVDASLKKTQEVIDLANRSELNHREKLYIEALKSLAEGYRFPFSCTEDVVI